MCARAASAQTGDDPATRDLVNRAIARRAAAEAGGLRSWRAEARGTVFFLAKVGPDPAAAPRLVKADQLRVEVYWQAPNRSKQLITGWRDQAWLPTDLRYHRDHLGIVTSDFGPAIRLGDGDEVRDVPHPLSAAGPAHYRYAVADTLTITTPTGTVQVAGVTVTPLDPGQPGVAGTLYVDVASGAIVRFRFSFTAASYREADLEGISVLLENALFEQRHWLPWRQEIAISRRTAWLEFPYRTVIQARWEIGDYALDAPIRPAVFVGGPWGGLRDPRPGDAWDEPLDTVVQRELGAMQRGDLDAVRREVAARLGSAAVANPPARPAFGGVSDLARVNRVQGLALGVGLALTPGGGAVTLRPSAGYGTANHRLTGGLRVAVAAGALTVTATAERVVRDFPDWAAASGVVNSVLAQEGGRDYGDYVQLDRGGVSLAGQSAAGWSWRAAAVAERPESLAVTATPSGGAYRSNPGLGGPDLLAARLRAGRSLPWTSGAGWGGTVQGEVGGQGGAHGYTRVAIEVEGRVAAGPGRLDLAARAGWGSRSLPLHRSFVLGGRGTLPGEPFRAWGGRQMAWSRAEWRVPVGSPILRLGSAPIGGAPLLAPFVAVGWTGGELEGSPWPGTGGIRPVLGLASELLFNALRIEAGWAPRSGGIGVAVDFTQPWWPIL